MPPDGFWKAYPAFQNLQILEQWGGMIDATPDAVPVIDKIDSIPGLYLASGFSGHGFGLGPGAGKLVAEIVTGGKPCVDPRPFRFARFIDGSKPRPTTGVWEFRLRARRQSLHWMQHSVRTAHVLSMRASPVWSR